MGHKGGFAEKRKRKPPHVNPQFRLEWQSVKKQTMDSHRNIPVRYGGLRVSADLGTTDAGLKARPIGTWRQRGFVWKTTELHRTTTQWEGSGEWEEKDQGVRSGRNHNLVFRQKGINTNSESRKRWVKGKKDISLLLENAS